MLSELLLPEIKWEQPKKNLLENLANSKSLINYVIKINNFINLIKYDLIKEFISDLSKSIII